MEIYNCDKISNWDESLSSWFEFIIMMKIHNENSSLLGKFIIAIEYSSLEWNSSIDEYFKLWLYKYFWWKFIIVMKIHQMLKNQHCNENSSLWWKFILMKIHHCDKKSSLWWKFIIVMKIHHYDENSSLWWKLIIVMKNSSNVIMRIRQRDNVHDCDWANSSLWWKIISVMKIHKCNYIHHWDTNSLV